MGRGEVPYLTALRGRSAVARLQDEDYRTGLVWEHFLTGRSAVGNRRWSTIEFDPETYEVWQEGARPVRPFYETSPSVPTIAFDVPYSRPTSRQPGGAVVTAWGGHDPGYPRAANPVGLLREIEASFGPHPAFNNDYEPMWHQPANIDALADALAVGTRRRAEISLWLQRRFDSWELFLTVMSEAHSAGEQLWHGFEDHLAGRAPTGGLARRRLNDVYQALDAATGLLVDGLPQDTAVVVFSMGGMRANHGDVSSMVLLPELLHRLYHGGALLSSPDEDRWISGGCVPLVPPTDSSWSHCMDQWWTEHLSVTERARVGAGTLLHAAYRQARRTNRRRAGESTSGALGRPIPAETAMSPDEIGVPRSSTDWQFPCRYRRYWPRSRAFALPSFYDGRIRVNVQGREAHGMVPVEDYDRFCGELEDELGACRDVRTGDPVVEEVIQLRRGAVLEPEGPEADLQVIWSDACDALRHPVAGTIGPFPYRRTGGHASGGFALVSEPGIAPSDLGERDALDVTPTLLHLLGRESGACEGKPLVTVDGAG